MVFSSQLFLFIFLPAALFFYYCSPRPLRFATLTLFSYLFYAWADPRFVLLLLYITLCDFTFGNLIGGHWRLPSLSFKSLRFTLSPRLLLALSLTNSLGLLAYFKYAMLGQELLNHLRASLGANPLPVIEIILPAGISFYTFESISYVVDIYRGITRPASEPYLASLPLRHQHLGRHLPRPLHRLPRRPPQPDGSRRHPHHIRRRPPDRLPRTRRGRPRHRRPPHRRRRLVLPPHHARPNPRHRRPRHLHRLRTLGRRPLLRLFRQLVLR